MAEFNRPTAIETQTPESQAALPQPLISITNEEEVARVASRFSQSWIADLEENESVLRSWKKGEKLGRGAYGEVFKAMVGGKFMAVKRITARYGATSSTAAVERESASLRKEIEVLRKLQNARIVSYEGCLVDGDDVLIFMEYMPGGSIRTMLKKFGPFGSELVRKLTRQTLEGLRLKKNSDKKLTNPAKSYRNSQFVSKFHAKINFSSTENIFVLDFYISGRSFIGMLKELMCW